MANSDATDKSPAVIAGEYSPGFPDSFNGFNTFQSKPQPELKFATTESPTPEPTSEDEIVEAQNLRRAARKKERAENVVYRPPDELFDGDNKEAKKGSHDEEGAFKGPQFTPRLYRQRYDKVVDVLRPYGKKLRKVVDFGCSECQWVRRAKMKLPEVKYLVGVDVDGALLTDKGEDNVDLDSDDEDFYYDRRPQPLNVKLYEGSIIDYDQRIADIDAAVCIEIIEHLYPEILDEVPESIFGQLRPFIAIFTTPNQEFNQLFHIEPGKFRHWDHKFEWTREEFQTWVDNILRIYPDYEVQIEGLGFCPERPDVGGCSQVAIFTMKCGLQTYLAQIQPNKIRLAKECDSTCPKPYKLSYTFDFPFDPWGNRREHLSEMCTRFLRTCAIWDSEGLEVVEQYSRKWYAVPIKQIYKTNGVKRLCRGIDDLRVFLMSEGFYYDTEKEAVLYCVDEPEAEEEYTEEEEEEGYEEGGNESHDNIDHLTEISDQPVFKGGFGWS